MVRFPEAGKEIIIGAFQSGEIFTIPPAMDGKSFPETAAAVEESELLLLKRMDFLALMGSSSKFSTIVMSRMCDLNVVSLMGMIMVVGIVARNGILMLDAVTANVTKSANFNKALIVSGHRRFRPVLMTSLTAILGMLPLALAIGEGSGLLQLLAIAVIGGLIFEPALSLIVTPTVY